VPFKYRPALKPLARSSGEAELAQGGERKFTWTEIRKLLSSDPNLIAVQ
jgi:hypothetical protein